MSYYSRKTCPKCDGILHTDRKWSKDSISKLPPLRWSWQGRGYEEDRFWAGQLWCFLNFQFPHLGQTSPRALQPSAPGMQAKATGQASGGKEEADTISGSIQRPYCSAYPIDVPSSYPVFQVFSLFSCILQGASFKMDDCLRPSH